MWVTSGQRRVGGCASCATSPIPGRTLCLIWGRSLAVHRDLHSTYRAISPASRRVILAAD